MIPPTQSENTLYTLGWDVAGEVIAAGSDCTLFGEGDSVYLDWQYFSSRNKQRISSNGRTYCGKKAKITALSVGRDYYSQY